MIQVGTGVKLAMSDQDKGYATGFVGTIGEGVNGPLHGVFWVWDGGPTKPDKLLTCYDPGAISVDDLCVWWTTSELVVMSQPDHDHTPSCWNNENLWCFPECHIHAPSDFVARWQHYGPPANPWS